MSCLRIIIRFFGTKKLFSEVKNIFLSLQTKLSNVNKTYINISNGQKFELLNSITFSKIVWCLPCWQLVGFYWFLRQSIVQALEPDNSRESLNSTCWTKSTESLCLALTASSYCGNPKVVMAGKFNLSAANKKEHDVSV